MALSANASYELRNTHAAIRVTAVIKTAVKVWKNALLVNGDDGLVYLPANATTSVFLGIATEGITTSLAGARTTAECWTNVEARIPIKSGITAGDVGHTAYLDSDAAVHQETTLGPPCGRITEVDGTSYVWVWLGHLTLGSAS